MYSSELQLLKMGKRATVRWSRVAYYAASGTPYNCWNNLAVSMHERLRSIWVYLRLIIYIYIYIYILTNERL